MAVRRTDRFPQLRRHLIAAAMKIAPQAGEIVNAAGKKIITDKDFIVTGTLRRSGFVSRPDLRGDTVRVTISFPMVYAPWIEFGKRKTKHGTVTMKSKVPGFLHEASVESADRVRQFVALSFRSALGAFR